MTTTEKVWAGIITLFVFANVVFPVGLWLAAKWYDNAPRRERARATRRDGGAR